MRSQAGAWERVTKQISCLIWLLAFVLLQPQACWGVPQNIGGHQLQQQDTNPLDTLHLPDVQQLPPQPNGEFAYQVLAKLCELGPRISGSPAMSMQIEWLEGYFQPLGATVQRQTFRVPHPETGVATDLTNLIVQWFPERQERILICCHYDTRPFPDRDPYDRHGIFLGANDGASGVGLLCELAPYLASLEGPYGVDFVFFDGEEFVYQDKRDPLFLGSTFFAESYARGELSATYTVGVLIDMIGDKELQIYYEKNSIKKAKNVTHQIWELAKELGIKEFIPRVRHEIKDDHLPLNDIAKIPTCDIIDFDFPTPRSKNAYWHTQQDTVENCSADSLAKVATVLLTWLHTVQKPPQKKRR